MSYLGSKAQAGVYQRIISNMPPHSMYVEPFFGSGQIFWRKRPAVRNVIIDADAGAIDEAMRILTSKPALGASTSVFERDALELLPKLAPPADAVVYCDPPYLHSTRTSRHRYKHELTDDQHTQLLTLLQALPCRVLLSGYPSQLYSDLLKGWRCESYRTRTRGRTLTECLWCNFPAPVELHDWTHLGQNHRERLTLRRFAARFNAKLDRMPELKRNFVLSLVHQRQNRRQDPHTPKVTPSAGA